MSRKAKRGGSGSGRAKVLEVIRSGALACFRGFSAVLAFFGGRVAWTLGIVLFAVAAFAMSRIRAEATSLDAYLVDPSFFRTESDVPPWMTRADVDSLRSALGELEPFSVFGEDVRARVDAALDGHPWVRSVRRVERSLPNSAEIVLDLRKPIAWVERRGRFFLVDRHGIRLPGRYLSPVPGLPYPMPVIRGDSRGPQFGPPPEEPGLPWRDEAVSAGLAVAIELYALYNAPLGEVIEITEIDVSNFGGRIDPARSEILLRTAADASIEWGRSPLYEGYGELPTEDKLRHLALIVAKYPRLEGCESVVVRFDDPTVRRRPGSRDGEAPSGGSD